MAFIATSVVCKPCTAAPSRPALSIQPRVARSASFRARAAPTTEKSAADKSAVEKAIEAAKETCEQGNVGACAAAWDEVEELAANVSDKKLTNIAADPLEEYCGDNPDADECRIYED
ncbi:hypothetical protein WJX73_009756 [Symbiochloris irregularis]|uniref:CP12 domain-containing protein n=1 Tax=Symbiochloris irregularis TaxID=706552 RepID=A0AAW1NSX9_9CHLO